VTEREATVTANEPSLYTIYDITMGGWRVELTHAEGWDCVQIASVNTHSHLTIEADDGDGQVPFTGWRVTLDKDALGRFIQECQDVHSRLP
jgi:hypothetical protein